MKTFFAILCFACIPVYGFWVFPTLNENETSQAQISKVQQTLEARQKKLEALRAQKQSLGNESSQSSELTPEEILEKVPEGYRQDLLIFDLEKLAKQHRFAFETLSFTKGVNGELSAPQITVNFSVTGPNNPEQFFKFLKSLESHSRFFMMDGLNFQTAEVNGVEQLSMTVVLRALSQPNTVE